MTGQRPGGGATVQRRRCVWEGIRMCSTRGRSAALIATTAAIRAVLRDAAADAAVCADEAALAGRALLLLKPHWLCRGLPLLKPPPALMKQQ
jgi:hypothetical protein